MCCSAETITRLSTVRENIDTTKEAVKKKADFEKDELFNRLYTATDVHVLRHDPAIA